MPVCDQEEPLDELLELGRPEDELEELELLELELDELELPEAAGSPPQAAKPKARQLAMHRVLIERRTAPTLKLAKELSTDLPLGEPQAQYGS